MAAPLPTLPPAAIRPGRHRPTGIATRLRALHAASEDPAVANLLRTVPILAAPLTDLLHHGPAAPVWRPVHDPDMRVSWMH
ncbi:hypothetical protein [Streptomyces sp. 1222.5]|uniref:hypothetical protein n=1 Tax=Streptomyces sp. 1222.5 TaxID=1881026 RepID=UPI003EBDD13A